MVKLDLSENDLSGFPESIIKLKTSLRYLDLHSNNLKNTPRELEKLSYLKVLFLDHNSLNNFPVCNNGLEILDLSYNNIRSLQHVDKLTSLKELLLNNNPINNLPDLMEKLRNLQTLQITITKNLKIPEKIIELPNIRWEAEILNNCITVGNMDLANKFRFALIRKILFQKNKKNLPVIMKELWAISYCSLISKDFKCAVWAGKRYVALCEILGSQPQIGALSNLALGYLWDGDFQNALSLLNKYKDKTSTYNNPNGEKGSNIFLTDIYTLDSLKIAPKDTNDVNSVVNILHGKKVSPSTGKSYHDLVWPPNRYSCQGVPNHSCCKEIQKTPFPRVTLFMHRLP